MKRCALIPVKGLADAKSRLGEVLTGRQRNELVLELLKRVLGVLLQCNKVREVLVVSTDPAVRESARRLGADAVEEDPADGLNGALARAADEAKRRGAGELLILPSDLPLLRREDINEVIREGGGSRFLVIVPDRHGKGTNLLYHSTSQPLPYRFGPDSFARHIQAAETAGFQVRILRSPGIVWDVDTPEDLPVAAGIMNKTSMS